MIPSVCKCKFVSVVCKYNYIGIYLCHDQSLPVVSQSRHSNMASILVIDKRNSGELSTLAPQLLTNATPGPRFQVCPPLL